MHSFLVFLALLGLSRALVLPNQNTNIVPPTSNPNVAKDIEGRERKASDPLPPTRVTSSDSAGLSDTNCDVNGIMAASGDNMVNMIKAVPWRCINDNFFLITGNKAAQACNEKDMISVANGFYYQADAYDGSKPQATPGIHSLATYLRACYYVQFYNSKDVGNYSENSLLAVLRYGFDKFLNRPNLDAKSDEHCDTLGEIISLISGVHDQLNYIVRLSQLFTKLTNSWNLESGTFSQANALLPFYDNFFRVHGTESDKSNRDIFFKTYPLVPQTMNDFMNRYKSLVGTNNEWLLRNAALELGRFLQYPSIYNQISGYVKSQFQKFTSNYGDRVWATLMNQILNYDMKNCAQWSACTFKTDLNSKILPITKDCGKTYVDTFVIRAQSMSDAEANEVCKRLKEEESYFHNLVKDNWKPVNPDTNDKIEVVIYNDRDSYQLYANIMYGISTDNGGMYLEGDPSKAGNVARYLCYESPYSKTFDVWNLEHEFVHYLDGRYNMKGDFGETSSGTTVWWIEGFAEYASKKNNGPSMVNDCKEKKWPLSTIFQNQYGVGEERIYHYGYLAVRFMFDRHRREVDTILQYFRAGKYPDYRSWFSAIGNGYDQEFNQWCDCIAKGNNSC